MIDERAFHCLKIARRYRGETVEIWLALRAGTCPCVRLSSGSRKLDEEGR
jgi:hypothetical protein